MSGGDGLEAAHVVCPGVGYRPGGASWENSEEGGRRLRRRWGRG